MKGLGLRAQILSALLTALVLSFSLLAIAVIQLAGKAQWLARTQAAEVTARVLGATTHLGDPALEVAATDLVASGAIAALEVAPARNGVRARVWGTPGTGIPATVTSGESTVTVWVPQETATAPMTKLLLLYVAITALGILGLAYVVLTLRIVRPVTALTDASERLAGGNLKVSVPVHGAGELARLAVAFNAMAGQLEQDRAALEARLKELERTTGELQGTQDRLVRSAKLASVGRLSAGVAHEIGNPLAAILGLVELLQDETVPQATQREFLARIYRETIRIHGILKDLLAFARHEGDGAAADLGITEDLAAVLREALELVRPQKDLQHITVTLDVPDAPVAVPGSVDRWTQIAVNLLLNAVDAIPSEGAVRVVLRDLGDQRTLHIEDTGTGIDAQLLEQLFEPFVTTKAPGAGTGLGLAVCQTLVERLGGRIEANNRPDGGATLALSVPAPRTGTPSAPSAVTT